MKQLLLQDLQVPLLLLQLPTDVLLPKTMTSLASIGVCGCVEDLNVGVAGLVNSRAVPALDQLSSSPPRPSDAPPLLCGVAPSPRCASSLPAPGGVVRAPAASSSRVHVVVAADGERVTHSDPQSETPPGAKSRK